MPAMKSGFAMTTTSNAITCMYYRVHIGRVNATVSVTKLLRATTNQVFLGRDILNLGHTMSGG